MWDARHRDTSHASIESGPRHDKQHFSNYPTGPTQWKRFVSVYLVDGSEGETCVSEGGEFGGWRTGLTRVITATDG